MADDAESEKAAVAGDGPSPTLSKSARKKQQKQERLAEEKERWPADVERRRREWEEALAAAPSEEAHVEMVAARRKVRRERAGQRAEERGAHAERLRSAAEGARQKVVLDLEFGDLMRPNEIHSLTQQIGGREGDRRRPLLRLLGRRCRRPPHLPRLPPPRPQAQGGDRLQCAWREVEPGAQ